jgi:hypothetical protein
MTTTATTNTLAQISMAAEKALFGQPDWTITGLCTADTLIGIAPAVTNKINRVKRVTASYSAAPATGLLTVKDGTTVIWETQLGSAGTTVGCDFDFSLHPLRGTSGASMTVSAPSGGGAIVQSLAVIGDTVAAP